MEYKDITCLKGETPVSVTISEDKEVMTFILENGNRVEFYHKQDCCESVTIEDVVGNLDDLEGSPLLMAEVATNSNEDHWKSQTWTYYKFATIKGYVDVRWIGVSNGYYSESVHMAINGIFQWQ